MRSIEVVELFLLSRIGRRPRTRDWYAGCLTLSEGARKYDVGSRTLSRWANKGYLGEIVRTRYEVLVLESTLAEAVRLFRSKGGPRKSCMRKAFARGHLPSSMDARS